MNDKQKTAVILLSGGLDSATCLAIAQDQGFACYSLCFDYGQRHRFELEMAKTQAQAAKVLEHKVIKVDLHSIGGSALTADIEVPNAQKPANKKRDKIPVTYVPARNTVFLSLGLSFAEAVGASHIVIGVNQLDYSGYPDCRREFLEAFESMAALATRCGVRGKPVKISAPLIDMTKAEIIKEGMRLEVDYKLTHSCYNPKAEGIACGKCDSCVLRLKGFSEAGLKDPISYL